NRCPSTLVQYNTLAGGSKKIAPRIIIWVASFNTIKGESLELNNIESIRPLKLQKGQNIFDQWAAIAENNMCFATHVLDWCVKEQPTTNRMSAAYKMCHLSLLRHLAEGLDAIPGLLTQRQITVAKLVLRSMLETTISLLYILKEKTDERTEAYLYMEALAAIKRRAQQDTESDAYKNLDALYSSDLILGPNQAMNADNITVRKRNQIELEALAKMLYAPAEYERLKKLPKGRRYIE
ncbi:MAG: DUF5677 domain-containing protein, partial [Rhabdochlamydiaceae bacterium]